MGNTCYRKRRAGADLNKILRKEFTAAVLYNFHQCFNIRSLFSPFKTNHNYNNLIPATAWTLTTFLFHLHHDIYKPAIFFFSFLWTMALTNQQQLSEVKSFCMKKISILISPAGPFLFSIQLALTFLASADCWKPCPTSALNGWQLNVLYLPWKNL